MVLWCIIKTLLIFLYIGLSVIVTYLIYNEERPFYKPLLVKKKTQKEGEKEETVNVHDEFDEYAKRDNPINLFKLFFGVLTIFWIRFILEIILLFYLNFVLIRRNKQKQFKLEKEDIKYLIKMTNYLTRIFLLFSGTTVDYKRLPDEEVLPIYKKYFGSDYKIDYNGKFSCYISNHTSLYDMACAMYCLGCGFVAKEAIKKTPFFGKMNIGLNSIFVDRSSSGGKKDVLEQIFERQRDYLDGKPVMPFLIFPEGTTTSGKHIITFKKGAFNSLLPIKPVIIHPNMDKKYHLSCGSADAAINFLVSLTKLTKNIEYIELPILTPNEYMYANFESYGKEKWEIYAEVAREIMCALGKFKKSKMGIRDSFRYCSCIKEKTFFDSDTYKIKEE